MAIHRLLAKRKSEGDAREGNKKNGSVSGGGGGVIFFPFRSPIPCFFFSPSCFSPSPAYIKGNENECYAGSQIYESKSCIRLTGHGYRLTSEIIQSCQHGDFWRENVIIVSCRVHKVTTMSEVTNISVYCHRKIPAIQQSLM